MADKRMISRPASLSSWCSTQSAAMGHFIQRLTSPRECNHPIVSIIEHHKLGSLLTTHSENWSLQSKMKLPSRYEGMADMDLTPEPVTCVSRRSKPWRILYPTTSQYCTGVHLIKSNASFLHTTLAGGWFNRKLNTWTKKQISSPYLAHLFLPVERKY